MVVGEGSVQAQIRELQVVLEINESRQQLAILAADDTLRWAFCVPHLVHLCQAACQALIVQRDVVTAQRERHVEALT